MNLAIKKINIQKNKNSKSKQKTNKIPIEQLINNSPETLFNKQIQIKSGIKAKNTQQSNNPTRINIKCGVRQKKIVSSSLKKSHQSYNNNYNNNVKAMEINSNINKKSNSNINIIANKYSNSNKNPNINNKYSSINTNSNINNRYSSPNKNINSSKKPNQNKTYYKNNNFKTSKNPNVSKNSIQNPKTKNQFDKSQFYAKYPQTFRVDKQQKLIKKLNQEQQKTIENIQNSQPATTRNQKIDKNNIKNKEENIKIEKNNFNMDENQLKESIDKIMHNKNGKIDEKSWGKIVSMKKSLKLSPEELMRILRAKNGLLLEQEENKENNKNDIIKPKVDSLIEDLLKTYEPDYINPDKDENGIKLRAKSFERKIIDPNYIDEYKVYKGNNKHRPKTFVEKVKELDKKEEIINNDIIHNKHKRMFQNLIDNKKNNLNKEKKEEKNDDVNSFNIINNINNRYILTETIEAFDKNWNSNKKFSDMTKKYFFNRMYDNYMESTTKTELSYKNKFLNRYLYGSNFIDESKNGQINKKTSNTINKIKKNDSFISNNIHINTEGKINNSNLKLKNSNSNCCVSERSNNKNNKIYYCSTKIYPKNTTEISHSIKKNIVNETYNTLLLKSHHKKDLRYEEENLYNSNNKNIQKNICFTFNSMVNHIDNKINELKNFNHVNKYNDYSSSFNENNYSKINDSKNSISNKSRKFMNILDDVSNKIIDMQKSSRGRTERIKRSSLKFKINNINRVIESSISKQNSRTIGSSKSNKKSLLDDIKDLKVRKRKYKLKNYY